MRAVCAFPILSFLLAAACGPRAPAADATFCPTITKEMRDAFLVHGARIFDGERVRDPADVLVAGGEIVAVGPKLSFRAVGGSVAMIDGAGATLMPGLIDAHMHALGDDQTLKRSLAFGVTTAIEMFGSAWLARRLRKQENDGVATGMADLRSAGTLATSPKGHGTQYGIAIPTVAGPADAKAFVAARFDEGSDFLKVVLERRAKSSLDRATVTALAEATHARGRKIVAHIGTKRDAEDAIASGVDGLVHGWVDAPADDALLAAIVAKHAFVIPNLSMMEMDCAIPTGRPLLADPRIGPALTADERKLLDNDDVWLTPPNGGGAACMETVFATVRALRGRTTLLAGTDAPNPGTTHGASLHRELELLVQAGLSPLEALASATSAPAEVFGLTNRGRIAPGMRADLLLVGGDPTRTITDTRNLRLVWKRGVRAGIASSAVRTSAP
jgi:imidazolonepropionase-like amidohydrolase